VARSGIDSRRGQSANLHARVPVHKTFKPADQLRAIYEQHDLTTSHEVIAYCWVGHRAAVDLFALHLIGYSRLRNYMGSWEEWSGRLDLPIAPFRQ